uniref:non-specific serine/threonine protein kinase n=1 Tax=Hyaloperonospora arabidopsidis (strain Emoy2) TaxID=559515 RepID=M4BL27_HYAAE
MTPAHVETAAPEASDFFFGTVLGQGSYAKVFHAQMKTSRADFAVKVMDQSFIRKENKTSFVLTERKVMSRLAHPNVVKFYCSFRDHHSLYLVMELCRGGDLFGLISNEYQKHQQEGTTDAVCSLELTQFYTAELTNALEYIHTQDQDGESSDVCQFCGTASYVSPEVLHDEPASRAADLWAMGCLIFQMFTGRAPFVAENDYLTFQVIINHSSDDFKFPSNVPEVAQDLIRKLLVQTPDERIGAAQNKAGYVALKNHAFFEGIEWDAIRNQTPPFSPPELELSEPTLDGASDNWTVAEYFTGDFSESASTEFNSKRSRSNSSVQRNRPPCIGYSEQIRFESTVKIRSKMFSRTRDLYLTDAPRLVVASSWSGRCKREMFLTPETSVKEIDPHTFDVESRSDTIRIRDCSHLAHQWARAISEAVSE